MKKILAFISLLIIVGCGGNAMVEFGMNDEETLLRGTLGDIVVWITKIEIPEDGSTYTTVWEGSRQVQVPIHSTDFFSITDNEVEIIPGSYQNIRLTADSLYFRQDFTNERLVNTPVSFIASAFTEIVIEEDDEMRLVVNIMSDSWFDNEELAIKDGHTPFEGAQLKIFYQY